MVQKQLIRDTSDWLRSSKISVPVSVTKELIRRSPESVFRIVSKKIEVTLIQKPPDLDADQERLSSLVDHIHCRSWFDR